MTDRHVDPYPAAETGEKTRREKILGHSSIAIYQRYVHLTPESLKRAICGVIEQDQLWIDAKVTRNDHALLS
jgi:hypothetical protein